MPAAERLAQTFLANHPLRAARVLDGLPVRDTARYLAREPAAAARVLARMTPDRAASCLARMHSAATGRVLLALPPEQCASLFRRLTRTKRGRVLAALGEDQRERLERLAAQSHESIGAHAEPSPLAIPDDVTAREAERRIRDAAGTGSGTVFVIDAEQRLLGVASLHDVLRASRNTPVRELARDELPRLQADWNRTHLLDAAHWRESRELPVVDDDGRLVGVVTYDRALRLREELRAPRTAAGSADTIAALGDLYVSGLIATLENLTAPGEGAQPDGIEEPRGD